jgi:hypothetical protein
MTPRREVCRERSHVHVLPTSVDTTEYGHRVGVL